MEEGNINTTQRTTEEPRGTTPDPTPTPTIPNNNPTPTTIAQTQTHPQPEKPQNPTSPAPPSSISQKTRSAKTKGPPKPWPKKRKGEGEGASGESESNGGDTPTYSYLQHYPPAHGRAHGGKKGKPKGSRKGGKRGGIPGKRGAPEMGDLMPNSDRFDSPEEDLTDEGGVRQHLPQGMMASELFIYKPFVGFPDLADYVARTIEVFVGCEYMCKSNKGYRERNFWGTDIYTSNSDVVCILQHSGLFSIKDLPPPSEDNNIGVKISFRVSKSRATYMSSLRNGIRSKKITGGYRGVSIKPENYAFVGEKGEGESPGFHTQPGSQLMSREQIALLGQKMPNVCLHTHRGKGSLDMGNVNAQPHTGVTIPETLFTFNLSCDPAYFFHLPLFQREVNEDSFRANVLYLETYECRYQVYREKEGGVNVSRVLQPFLFNNQFMLDTNKIPLLGESIEVMFEGLEWSQLNWGEDLLCILHKENKEEGTETETETYIKPIHSYKLYPRKDKKN